MKLEETINYFKDKADEYDLVEDQIYWVLSDKLLWEQLNNQLKKLPSNFHFLDAGGGTGRWSLKILQNYPKATGMIFDLSEDMLRVAKQKFEKEGVANRIEVKNGNLDTELPFADKFDLIINFHNVLGFVKKPEKTLQNLSKKLSRNGLLVSFIPNLYHLIYFNVNLGRLDEAEYALKNQKGRFTREMPYIHIFTPEGIAKLYKRIGLKVESNVGFPVTIYPNFQETQLKGSTKSLSDLLSSRDTLDRIYKIEKSLLADEAAPRGNNLFIVGKK